MEDYVVRIIAKEANVRGLVCVTTELVNEAVRRHSAGPAAAIALGHSLTAAALLGASLKVQQRVAIKVEGNGPLRKLVAESDSYGRLRGYVAVPDVIAPDPSDLANTLGDNGLLTVVKDLRLKELYEGVVPLQTGELDQNLTAYLLQSEQVPSIVEIGASLASSGEVAAAGGLLLQSLPHQTTNGLQSLAEQLDDLPPIEAMLHSGQRPEELLAALFVGIPYETLETFPLRFQCSCSWAWAEQALVLLDRSDLEILIEEGQAVVDCHFCHERYIFGREALEMLLEKLA